MTRPTLWAVRHAPVGVQGVCYGQSDVPTQVDARAAADAILLEIEGRGIRAALDAIWTSPWERTRSVAAALGARLGLPVSVDRRLSELSFGRWEGRRYAEIEASEGARFAQWMAQWETDSPPGGERVADLVARVVSWRAEASAASASPLVVTHAGPIRVLRAVSRGIAYADVATERVEHLRLEELSP